MKLLRKLLLFVVALSLVLVIAGYISNLMTRDKCEAQVAKRMLEDLGLGQIPMDQINFMPSFPTAGADVFRAAGLRLSECRPEWLEREGCFPWAEMDTVLLIPFVISIRWGCADAPLSGEGKRSTFVCAFGTIIRFSEQDLLVS